MNQLYHQHYVAVWKQQAKIQWSFREAEENKDTKKSWKPKLNATELERKKSLFDNIYLCKCIKQKMRKNENLWKYY